MGYETLQISLENGLARLTLSRPDAANALNRAMARELMLATAELDGHPAVGAVLLSGAGGRFFCAGGDLAAMSTAGEDAPRLLREMTSDLHAAVARLARMPAPVVAAVQGMAAGAGFSLVCASDLAIAGESAKLTMAYTRAGLVPDGSSTFFLSRLVGLRRATELALTNRLLDAGEACEWGLLNKVVPDDEVMASAEELARGLAEGPTNAFGATKQLLIEGAAGSLETQMERESRSIAAAIGGAEGREGVTAFLAKRKPRFHD